MTPLGLAVMTRTEYPILGEGGLLTQPGLQARPLARKDGASGRAAPSPGCTHGGNSP